MATITYNGLQNAAGLITYTDIPNILKISDQGGGQKAKLTITISGNLASQTTNDGQWYISVLGDTITNVTAPENAVSKNFYISNTNGSTAASICRALRNCPTIAANFNVTVNSNMVSVQAKAIGPIWSTMVNYFQTNIPSTYVTSTSTDGSAASSLFGAKIDVTISSNGEYITTLEKNFYGSSVAFNLSPVLTSISKLGKTTPYGVGIYKLDRYGEYGQLGALQLNHSVVGYMVNQGEKYNSATTNSVIAQNMSRGDSRGVHNKSLLYTYFPEIAISYYSSTGAAKAFTIYYKDSAFNTIYTGTYTHTPVELSNILQDVTIPLNSTYFNQSFYIDIKFNDTNNTVRYNVIKPLKMTEYGQRVYFRNSYGGISFFDFTGQKSESRDLEIMTYEKNIFDYYTSEMNDLEKIYDNTVKYTVSLKSHLFENDGKYIFNDMLQSPELWVYRNGEKYAIIIDSITVDETSNNGIYEATLKYHYSMEPSLI